MGASFERGLGLTTDRFHEQKTIFTGKHRQKILNFGIGLKIVFFLSSRSTEITSKHIMNKMNMLKWIQTCNVTL